MRRHVTIAALAFLITLTAAASATAAIVPLNGRSMQQAYIAANCGDEITFSGSIGSQTIDTAPKSCTGPSGPVVFRPADGASASLTGFRVNQGAHIELRDIAINGTAYLGCNCSTSGQAGAVVHHITYRNVQMRQFFVRGADDVSFIDSDVGPLSSGNMNWLSAPYQSNDSAERILFDGTRVHDILASAQGDHTDCIGVDDVNGLTIRNSRVERCQHFAIIFGNDLNGKAARNVVIENSVLDCCSTQTGVSPGFYSIGFGGLDGPVTLRKNRIPGAGLGWLNDTALVPNGLVTVEGNTIATNNTANCSRATWAANTVASGACPGDASGPVPTATPTATPSPTPTATPTPRPTPTPTPGPVPVYDPACRPDCDAVIADLRTENSRVAGERETAHAELQAAHADLLAERALRIEAEADRDEAIGRLNAARNAQADIRDARKRRNDALR